MPQKQTFIFQCAEHEEFGSNGWRLKSQPDFDPLGGMAVAHDCLEHFTDSAEPADEFLALGASMWLRDNQYRAYRGQYTTDPGANIAADLPDILRHVIHEGYRLREAPRTRATDEDCEDAIRSMFAVYRKELREYHEDERREMRINRDTERTIRSWLRLGYRKARRRYRDRQWEAGQLFTQIEQAADKHLMHAEPDLSELHVTVDFRNLEAKVTFLDYPEEGDY